MTTAHTDWQISDSLKLAGVVILGVKGVTYLLSPSRDRFRRRLQWIHIFVCLFAFLRFGTKHKLLLDDWRAYILFDGILVLTIGWQDVCIAEMLSSQIRYVLGSDNHQIKKLSMPFLAAGVMFTFTELTGTLYLVATDTIAAPTTVQTIGRFLFLCGVEAVVFLKAYRLISFIMLYTKKEGSKSSNVDPDVGERGEQQQQQQHHHSHRHSSLNYEEGVDDGQGLDDFRNLRSRFLWLLSFAFVDLLLCIFTGILLVRELVSSRNSRYSPIYHNNANHYNFLLDLEGWIIIALMVVNLYYTKVPIRGEGGHTAGDQDNGVLHYCNWCWRMLTASRFESADRKEVLLLQNDVLGDIGKEDSVGVVAKGAYL
mmetsp:Transcript_5807/g.9087  ORF Transcript_5807/g.9087 Transcript_5807/m.9087 type:complete len:369 (+) Transcript_5807:53-1159(+)|eukprot:jgi/Bigna1/65151/fgenesh1_kg.98_\